jgi:threonine dehydrogenase-like Zn-dependent dehydrogenase
MKGIGLDFEQRTLVEFELPEPEPGPGEVLLRMVEAGVCGTDRELAHFRFGVPPGGETRLVLGHEGLGEVVEGAHGLAKGDLVVPMIRRSCAVRCRSCTRGRRDLCETGRYQERGIVALHGYFAPYAADPAEDLVRVPEGLADVAVLVEPMSVVEKAVETAFRLHPGEPRTALVQGAGPIGILTALVLSLRGMDVKVWSREEPSDPRVRLLRRAEIEYTRSEAGSADLVMEATGAPEAAGLAVSRLATLGVLVLIGACDFPIEFPGVRMVVDNLSVAGVVNGARVHFERALADLAACDRRVTGGLITRKAWRHLRDSIASESPEPKLVHVASS